jgi:hypothetical protein
LYYAVTPTSSSGWQWGFARFFSLARFAVNNFFSTNAQSTTYAQEKLD